MDVFSKDGIFNPPQRMSVINAFNEKPIPAPISCGCCANPNVPLDQRCICYNHMDIPRGFQPQLCYAHAPDGRLTPKRV